MAFHPYFDHPYFNSIGSNMNQEIVTMSHPNIPVMKNHTSIPEIPADPYKYPVNFPAMSDHSIAGRYTPSVVDHMLSNPTWIEADPYLSEAIARNFNFMNKLDGYHIDIDSRIVHDPAAVFNGYMCAQAFQLGQEAPITYPTYIVNTKDAGLRMVTFAPDGFPMDNGPVEDVMIVGNETRPEGIYVPFCNAKAMADAAFLLGKELEHYENNLIETLNNEVKSLPEATSEEVYVCKCGGNCKCGGVCKCGGSCCGNCKCHHD